MASVREIYDFLDQKAPFSLQMDFDNAGFLVGHGEKAVTRIVVALDITEAVAEEAARVGAQLIVSHHPVIFHPVRRLTDDDLTGRLLLSLTERGIAAICAHTNLDVAEGGVNDALARSLELEDAVPFQRAQVVRKHLLRDAGDPPLQFTEPLRSMQQVADDQ